MLFTRRQIIQGIGGMACFPFVSAFAEMNNVKTDRMYISGSGFPVTSGKDEFFVSAFDGDGNEKFKEIIVSKIPSGKLGEPEDIANAVLFLVSNQSNYINGETLHVNGGMYMA